MLSPIDYTPNGLKRSHRGPRGGEE